MIICGVKLTQILLCIVHTKPTIFCYSHVLSLLYCISVIPKQMSQSNSRPNVCLINNVEINAILFICTAIHFVFSLWPQS